MFVLVHLSDLHMAASPRLGELAGKRGLGFINWQRKRKRIHRPEALDAITRDLKRNNADHIAVTGDLVNLSLADEYRLARAWLDALDTPHNVTVVPGNHDIYLSAARPSPAAFWDDYMCGDDDDRNDDGGHRFPFLRRRGDIALIALNSAVPTGPFMATGTLGAPQIERFAQMLAQSAGLFRIVLIHHPPLSSPRRHLRRLTDAADLRRVLAEHGAELLLYGHNHRRAIIGLDGPRGTKIPAVGVPSASAIARHGSENEAGYHVFHIDRQATGAMGATSSWRCEMLVRQRGADGTVRDGGRQTLHEPQR